MYRPRRGRRPLTRQALPPSSAEEHPKGHSIDEGERTISSAEKQWAEDISSQRKRMHDVRVDISQGQESKGRDGHHCPSETHSRLEASNFRPPKAHGPPQKTTGEESRRKRSRYEKTASQRPLRDAPSDPSMTLSDYLPEDIVKQYLSLGKSQALFGWQAECLRSPGVLDGKSIVYCAPTSAGKSLVAEILMLRRLSSTSSVGMLVLPFVALCSEKANQLESLLVPLQKKIRRFYGSKNSPVIFKRDTGILVCTIEKANILINRMMEENILDRLGIVVVDELHMVDDPYRGYLLELMLTKLRYMSLRGTPADGNLQIVGMSATMPNGHEVAQWLGAELYITDVRPVPLRLFLKVGTSVLDVTGTEVRQLEPPADWTGDPDHVAWLTKETVDQGHSVLIFCCSKKACVICAEQISKLMTIPVRDVKGSRRRSSLTRELGHALGEHQQKLLELIPQGIAFHHAGLSSEERQLVEKAYRSGAISVLTATSTLAAGVNLPARRVIFREPYVGLTTNVLDPTSFRQMAGRAGRAGIDDEGEAYLLESKYVKTEILQNLIKRDADPVSSCLSKEKNGMIRLLHEVISTGAVKTGSDVERLIQSTLLAQTPGNAEIVSSTANDGLTWLSNHKLIMWHPAHSGAPGVWICRSLSKAITASGMDPRECALVKKDLLKAQEHLILATDLHLAYLTTPHTVELSVDWEKLYYLISRLTVLDTTVTELVGVDMLFLQRKCQGSQCSGSQERERIGRRFYAALILRDIVSETPLPKICQNFNLSLSAVEDLRERSLRYANMSAIFCGVLRWAYLHVLIEEFQKRIYRGARPEIIQLTEIPYVKAHRARLLYEAGFRSIEEIAELHSVDKLVKTLTAEQGVDGRQEGLELQIARRIIKGAQSIVMKRTEVAAIEEDIVAETESLYDGSCADEITESFPEDMDSSSHQLPTHELHHSVPEMELSASLRRLSVKPSKPDWISEGIAILSSVAEMQSLVQYVLSADVCHISFQSHFSDSCQEVPSYLAGVALCFSDMSVTYVALSDEAPEILCCLVDVMQKAEMQKTTFGLGDSMHWIKGLLQRSALAAFPSVIDVQEAAKYLEGQSSATNDLEGLFQLFQLEEEYQSIKEFYANASEGLPNRFVLRSCCSAAALTRKLWIVLQEKLQREGLLDVFQDIQMPHAQISETLSQNGLFLDRKRTMQQLALIDEIQSDLQSMSTSIAGTVFDFSNSDQIVENLVDVLKLNHPMEVVNSQDKEIALRALQDQHPLPAIILQLKRWSVLRESLSFALNELPQEQNSVWLRADLFERTVQSWEEKEKEFLQSLPLHRVDRSADGSLLMSPLEAQHQNTAVICHCLEHYDGKERVIATYQHLDVWLLAHFSQDRALINALIQEGIDPFRAIAGAISRKPLHEARTTSQSTADYFERFLAGFLCGASSLLSAYILRVGEKRAQECYREFSAFFTGVESWIQRMVECTKQGLSIRTLFGRGLKIKEGSDIERCSVRWAIQGSLDEILKRATIQLHQRGASSDQWDLLFRHHHGFLLEIPQSQREMAEKAIQEIMYDVTSLPYPVQAYLRYRHDIAFGIVASHGNALYDSTGEFFVTASLEGVAVWKSRTGERIALLLDEEATSAQRPIEVKTLARSRQEHLTAAGYSDGSIRIWDLSTYQMRTSFHGHKRPVSRLCFSASGELLASGSQDTQICLWDVIGETGLFKLQGHGHEITGLCFLKDRQLLVSVAKDGQLKLWDLTSQHCCQTVLHDKGVIWSLALHPRQCHVVIGSVDASLIVYELKEGEMPSLDVRMKMQRREENRVRSLAFSENGEYLVCQGNTTSAEIFEVLTEEVARQRYEERRQKAEKVLRELERKRAKEGSLNKKLDKKQRKNEKILQERLQDVVLYQSLTIYQASSKLLSIDFRPGMRCELGIALSSNAFEMVGFEHSSNNRKVLEYTQRLEVYREGHRSSIRSLCLSSDNQFLLSLSEKEAKIWNTETAFCVHTLSSGYGLSGIFAPGDSVVVVGTKSGALELFDLLSSTKIESVPAHEGPVWSITPIKDDKGFVSGGADGAIKVWNWGLTTGEGDEIKRVTIQENEQSLRLDTDVLCVVLSANGRFLAVALLDATIQIYYVDSFQIFLTLYGHKLPVLSIDISADSQLIVSGSADKNIKIWGLDFGDCHKSIFAHKDSVTQVAFVHTTHYVMSVGKDGMLKYWDADKFELLLELSGHHAEVWCLSMSHEGGLVFTGSSDRSLRKWSRTDEPFFLEYEKEKRMEALFDEDPVEDSVPQAQGLAGEKSQTTLSAADSILEALELASFEARRGSADPPNPLLCGLEPAAFVLQAVQKIKPSDLEVALLSLPFTDALQLLTYLADWLKKRCSQTEVICRVLLHLLRLHYRPLSTSLHVRSLLQNLQSSLRIVIGEMKDTVGFNLEAVRYIRSLTQNDEKTAAL